MMHRVAIGAGLLMFSLSALPFCSGEVMVVDYLDSGTRPDSLFQFPLPQGALDVEPADSLAVTPLPVLAELQKVLAEAPVDSSVAMPDSLSASSSVSAGDSLAVSLPDTLSVPPPPPPAPEYDF
ncbi:hypothetical protein [Chlorobium phaeovibrioides]|uniref:Secreted protein n=1 Tax=Chlorobium phaeovibrioides TaxID=1094 RepID=A0A5M8I8Z1_CHLPH|nr:hypothetical protein [Chlorobium phaeovibrioides]KAA6231821.1 hypothetical protein FP507_00855 [Chlorobium phaeovibrioides]MWV54176.1 hypothetical protein [Chlorobium phaeovibrioides]